MALVAFPIFTDLNTLVLRQWDESRLAINAYEMYKTGHYLIPHYRGHPDMWNTKPPLLIWMQALCMKLMGVGELAVRLPSAISAFLTAILLMIFCDKHLKSFWWGAAAALVLVTAHGYIRYHGARNGDYDAPLTLFTTLYCLAFYHYLETKHKKYITLAFIGITLAVLTKSIQGLIFIPAIAVYIVARKQAMALLRSRVFYLNLIASIVIIGGYYLLRNYYNPGYLNAVYANELGGRYLQVNEGHVGSFWYYYGNFIDFQFSSWYLLVPIGAALGIASKNRPVRNFTLYISLLILTYFLVISTAKTKLQWYDIPLYPLLALLIGGILPVFLEIIKTIEEKITIKPIVLQYVSIFLIFFYPYKTIVNETYNPHEYSWDADYYAISYYLRDAKQGVRNLNNYHLCYTGYSVQEAYCAQNLFYLNILNDMGQKIDIQSNINLQPADKIIVCEKPVEDSVLSKYNCTFLGNFGNIKTYRILNFKNN